MSSSFDDMCRTEMEKTSGLCIFFLLLIHLAICTSAAPKNCGSTWNKPSGKIETNNTATPGKNCTWTLDLEVQNSSFKYVFLQFEKLELLDKDTVYVEEDDETTLLFSGNKYNFVYITNTLNPKIILDVAISKLQPKRVLEAKYSSQACIVNVNQQSGMLVSPVVGSNVTKFNCTYTTQYSGNTVQYISFSEFDIGENSLSIHNGAHATSPLIGTYSGSQEIPDAISLSHAITVFMKLDYSNSVPEFQFHFSAITQSCSGLVKIEEKVSNMVILKSPNYPDPYPTEEMDCRWIISGKYKFYVNFNKLEFADQFDTIEIKDGSRKDGEMLAIITNKTYSPYRHIFSSKNAIWFRFFTDSGPAGKGFTANVVSEEVGGYYKNKGDISLPENEAATSQVYAYLLEVAENEQVQLNVSNSHKDTLLSPNAQLWFYDGFDEKSSQLLDVFVFSTGYYYDVVSTGNKLMILAKTFDSSNKFKANFNGIPYGYHNVSVDDVGIKTVDSQYMGPLSWIIRPHFMSKETNLIALSISDINMNGNDWVKIYKLNSQKEPLLTYNAKNNKPVTINVPIVDGIRVEIERSYKYASPTTVFTASYKIVPACKKSYDMSKTGRVAITSLNFPNEYPLYAECTWMFALPKNKGLHLTFSHLDTLPYQPVNFNIPNEKVSAAWKGSVLPSDFIISETQSANLTFNSVVVNQTAAVGSGFRLVVSMIDCGGSLTNLSGVIQTPKNTKKVLKKTLCIWSVSVPWIGKTNDSHQYITFSSSITPTSTADLLYAVHDGGSVRDANVANVTAKSGGQSLRNNIVVVYNDSGNKLEPGLSITYQASTCNKERQCDDGICIHDNWRCDGIAQCKDMADERNCSPHIAPEKVTKGVPKYVIAIVSILFFIAGVLLGVFGPKCYRRYKTGEMYSSFSNIPVVTD